MNKDNAPESSGDATRRRGASVGYASMTPEQRLAWLKERYRDTYEWAERQPCTSYDFVQVPIESLENLLHGQPGA